MKVARLVIASMTAPSSATSPPTSFAVSAVTLDTWLVIVPIVNVAARLATKFLGLVALLVALEAVMQSTVRWRYVFPIQIPKANLTTNRTLCKNSLEIPRTALRVRSKPLLLATHGIKAAMEVENRLVPGNRVRQLSLVVALLLGLVTDRTTMVVVKQLLHGLSVKIKVAMVVATVLLLVLLVLLAVVQLHGRLRLPHLHLLAAMAAMAATLVMISQATAALLRLLLQVSATSFSSTASKRPLLHLRISLRHHLVTLHLLHQVMFRRHPLQLRCSRTHNWICGECSRVSGGQIGAAVKVRC